MFIFFFESTRWSPQQSSFFAGFSECLQCFAPFSETSSPISSKSTRASRVCKISPKISQSWLEVCKLPVTLKWMVFRIRSQYSSQSWEIGGKVSKVWMDFESTRSQYRRLSYPSHFQIISHWIFKWKKSCNYSPILMLRCQLHSEISITKRYWLTCTGSCWTHPFHCAEKRATKKSLFTCSFPVFSLRSAFLLKILSTDSPRS